MHRFTSVHTRSLYASNTLEPITLVHSRSAIIINNNNLQILQIYEYIVVQTNYQVYVIAWVRRRNLIDSLKVDTYFYHFFSWFLLRTFVIIESSKDPIWRIGYFDKITNTNKEKIQSFRDDRESHIISRTIDCVVCDAWVVAINETCKLNHSVKRTVQWMEMKRLFQWCMDKWLPGEVQCDHDRVSFRPSDVGEKSARSPQPVDRLVCLYHCSVVAGLYGVGWVHSWN